MSNALERLKQGRTRLTVTDFFFGSLLSRLELVNAVEAGVTEVDTMATDGGRIYFHPDFVDSLSNDLLAGVQVHEVLHCALGHHDRMGSRDPELWNQACDYAINPKVIQAGYRLPADALIDPAFDGKSAEEVYAELKANPKPKKSKPGQGQGQGQGQPQPGNGQGKPGKPDMGMGGVMKPKADSPSATEWHAITVQAAMQAKAAGQGSANIQRVLAELRQPKVDLRAELLAFMTNTAAADYSWKRPSPRYLASGIYMPSLYSQEMPPVALIIDTSGSIGNGILAEFNAIFRQVVEEVCPEVTHVLYADARVCGHAEFERGTFGESLRPKGGGGTHFAPAFQWLKDHDIEPACAVYLTDLEGGFGEEPDYPVLWVSTTRKTAPWGRTIHMGDAR